MSQDRLRRTPTLRMLGPEHAVGAVGQFAGSGEREGPVIKATANVQEEHEEEKEKPLFLNISNFLNFRVEQSELTQKRRICWKLE